MKDRICLITGANSGIGEIASRELARMGASVIMVCRDKQKAEATRRKIVEDSGNQKIEILLCNLASQKQIRQMCEAYENTHDRLHVLINNAAIVPRLRTVTEDGIETQLAVNHLAPFLTTRLLQDILKTSAPARIITVTSGMHKTSSIDFEDLQHERKYKSMRVYAMTKLCNILFTYELARRLEDSGVTANTMTPGFTSTNLGRDFPPLSRFMMKVLGKKIEEGAEPLIHLASSAEFEKTNGNYFEGKKKAKSSSLSYDKDLALRLWEISEKLTCTEE